MHKAQYVLHADTPNMVLQSVFKKYDEDGSGELDIQEFSDALTDLGVIDEHEQKAIFHLADADNGGTVCIDEFIQLIKGHEFDNILASHESLEFIYQTHKQFEKFDADGNGEISWDEFYFYLTKQGYTHQQISHNWHYLDVDKNSKVTFDEFWKGYKAIAEAQLQAHKQQLGVQNDADDEKQDKKNKKVNVKIIPHLEYQSFSNKEDDSNILHSAKNKLKKSTHKMNKSAFKQKVGKVMHDENENKDDFKDENGTNEEKHVKEDKVCKKPKDDST